MKSKLAITLASSALLAGGAASGATPAPGQPPTNAPALQAAKLAAMNKAELKKLLARLAEDKAPAPKMGAMCYSVMAPPERMEYVCPKCGEKTLHAREVSWAWTYELDRCRRLFKDLPNRDALALAEIGLCKQCQPNATGQELSLTIRFDDGTSHTTGKVTSSDLRLLRDFLGKKLMVADAQDFESPIKDQLPRLKELLGMTEERK